MKIVHSLWTRPWRGTKYLNVSSKFIDPMFHWACMTYSCLKAKELYGRIELVTDSCGANAVKSLGIPYDQITLELDNIPENVPSSLWTYGKIVAYGIQNEPFWHIDNDSIILERMPSLESADIICQNEESPVNVCWADAYPMSDVMDAATYRPVGWDTHSIDKKAFCTGIFGGQDYTAIQGYAQEIIHAVEGHENTNFWTTQPRWDNFAICIEQRVAYCYFKQQEKTVTSYITMDDWADRFKKAEFCHLMARKLDSDMYRRLMDRLAREYPGDYSRLKSLIT